MEFIEFRAKKRGLNQKEAQGISDNAGISKKTVFQYLCDSTEYTEDPSKLDELFGDVLEWLEGEGYRAECITESIGLTCETDVYSRLGGLGEKLSSVFMPFYRSANLEKLIITTKPDDVGLLEKLSATYGGRFFKVCVCNGGLWESLQDLYVRPFLLSQQAKKLSLESVDGTQVQDVREDSETRKLYRDLVNAGMARNASDIHFLPCSDTCQVLYRIDGVNHIYTEIPKNVLEKISNIIKVDAKIPNRSPREALDGKIRYSPSGGKVPNDAIDLRVSLIPAKAGMDISVRYLSSKLFTFEQLGMTQANIDQFIELLNLPSGMVVMVGPTGSGKSTTLYTGLAYIHNSLRNIMTAEDPVEILMDGISQFDVDSDEKSKFTFSDALKASLRHDPDVVVVGELRDADTAALAIRAANTGHLVLTSLHTNDSLSVFERLINLGVEPYSLGEVIAAVMSQRLVRRLCPVCKQAYEFDLSTDEAKKYGFKQEDKTITLYRPVGCVKCGNTGYHGRVAINEILRIDSKLRDFIQRHATRNSFEVELHNRHFRTMFHDGMEKVINGITSLDEMKCYANDSLSFKG